jgi:hypothetical protein
MSSEEICHKVVKAAVKGEREIQEMEIQDSHDLKQRGDPGQEIQDSHNRRSSKRSKRSRTAMI